MSFSPSRRSPTKNGGRNLSPGKQGAHVGANAANNLRKFSKDDLLMSSVLPVNPSPKNSKQRRPEPPQMTENQQIFLQHLNGQISHLESEFKELAALKDSVDHAESHHHSHTIEVSHEEKVLLEQKEHEYLSARKDRTNALHTLASEIKLLMDSSPEHSAPNPNLRRNMSPPRDRPMFDSSYGSADTHSTPLKLSELSALASADQAVSSRTVDRILSDPNLRASLDLSTAAPAPAVVPSAAPPSFLTFAPHVYKPLDNKFLTHNHDDLATGAGYGESPVTSTASSAAALFGRPLGLSEQTPVHRVPSGEVHIHATSQPSFADRDRVSRAVEAPPSQGVYAANPVSLHASRGSGSANSAAPRGGGGSSGSAATHTRSPQAYPSAQGGSQPAAPISQVGGPGGGGHHSSNQGHYSHPTHNQHPHGSGRGHPHQEHYHQAPPPPPPYVEQEEPRFSNEDIAKMMDMNNATTQQYLTLLQTQLKSLEIKQQTSENSILLRLAAVESRLDSLESHHKAAVSAHQVTLAKTVPVEEFEALKRTVETLTEAYLKTQKQVAAQQAQAAASVHKNLGLRIMNGISNSLQGGGGGGPLPEGVSGHGEESGLAPVQELGHRVEQLEQTLIAEREASNRAMHEMMVQHQQENRLEALEHRKEILELMKSNRNHSGPEYEERSPHSQKSSGHSSGAAAEHSLRERRRELLASTVTPIRQKADASEIHEISTPFVSSSGPKSSSHHSQQHSGLHEPHYSDDPALINPALYHHQHANPDTIRVRPNAAGYLRSINAIPPLPQLPLLPAESPHHEQPEFFQSHGNGAFQSHSGTASGASSITTHGGKTSRSTTPSNAARKGADASFDETPVRASHPPPSFKPVVPEYHYETLLQSKSRLFPTFPQGIAASTAPGSAPGKQKAQNGSRPGDGHHYPHGYQPHQLNPHHIKASAAFMQPTVSNQIKLWNNIADAKKK